MSNETFHMLLKKNFACHVPVNDPETNGAIMSEQDDDNEEEQVMLL